MSADPTPPATPPAAPGRYECGVCWTVYDPDAGDPDGGVSPGTAFEALPARWVCPHCEAPQVRFMAVVA
jgi:rubredoxin